MSVSQCFDLFSAYEDASSASKQLHGCDQTVLDALQAYYNLCGDVGSLIVPTPAEMVAYCVDNDGIQLRLADSSPSATSNAISSSGSNSSVPFVSTASNPSETRGVTTSAVTSTAQTVISVILTSATMTFVPTTSASSQPSVPPSPSSPATPPPSSTVIMTNSFSSTQSALPAPSGPNAAAIAGSLIAVLLLVSFCFGVSHFVFQRRNKKSDELLIGPHTAYLQMDDEHDVYDIPLYYAQAAVVHGIARTDTTGSSTSLAMPRRGDTVFSAETLSRGITESSVHSKTDQTTVADNPFADTPPPAPVMKSFRVAIAPTDPPSVVHVSPSEELSVLPVKQKGRPAFEAILDASYKDGGRAREQVLRGTPPALWSVDQVSLWVWGIPEMGPEVAKMMRYHKVRGDVLLRLRREDLRIEFGLVLGDAVLLEAEIDKLREVEEAPPMYSASGRRQ